MRTVELCKTRAKNSSPDMFNFHVNLAGHDKVSDNGRHTTCGSKKSPMITNKSAKNEGALENMGFKGKTV